MEEYQVYQDISARTNGEIYIGVVGPVRTGKSTFIKRFMSQMVIPHISNENDRELAQDELPQSAAGKTIMTTEPKFIPKDAVSINVDGNIDMKIKMIDCVGYVVKDAEGQFEDGRERMVRTPWFDYDIPFSKAAEIGTSKVINNHSTVGIVVTTDGSFGDLPRESYVDAEAKTIEELKGIGKPFVVLLNTDKPSGSQAKALSSELSDTYGASVIPVNIEQLRDSDITYIFSELLMSFPVTAVYFDVPKWLEVADESNEVKNSVICDAAHINAMVHCLRDIDDIEFPENSYVNSYRCNNINMADGRVYVSVDINSSFYYQMLSEMMGADITNEYDFITELKQMSGNKNFCMNIMGAMEQVKSNGYGLVMPDRDNIQLGVPEVVKTGSKFGVRITASAPSVNMIKANVSTEIMPLVGTKEQADDLVTYISDNSEDGNIWNVNIFGKTIEQLVDDGLNTKVSKIGAESQHKLQNTMEKIVNDGNGGMVCIII